MKNTESSELYGLSICSSSSEGKIGKVPIKVSVSCGASSFSKGDIVSVSDLLLLSSCFFCFCLVPFQSSSFSFSCSFSLSCLLTSFSSSGSGHSGCIGNIYLFGHCLPTSVHRAQKFWDCWSCSVVVDAGSVGAFAVAGST